MGVSGELHASAALPSTPPSSSAERGKSTAVPLPTHWDNFTFTFSLSFSCHKTRCIFPGVAVVNNIINYLLELIGLALATVTLSKGLYSLRIWAVKDFFQIKYRKVPTATAGTMTNLPFV